jgi:hypothetical protein
MIFRPLPGAMVGKPFSGVINPDSHTRKLE